MCIPASLAKDLFVEYFKEFNQKYPKVRFDFYNRPQRETFDLIAKNKVDFVIDLKQTCEEFSLKTIDLFTHECIFIASEQFLKERNLNIDLTKEQLINLPMIAHRDFLKLFIAKSEIKNHNLFITTSVTEPIFELVLGGLGVGQYYNTLLRKMQEKGNTNVVSLNIKDLKMPKLTVVCGYNEEQIIKAAKVFINGLAKYCLEKI